MYASQVIHSGSIDARIEELYLRARSRAGSRDTAAATTAATATAGAGTLLNGRTENRYRNAVLWKK